LPLEKIFPNMNDFVLLAKQDIVAVRESQKNHFFTFIWLHLASLTFIGMDGGGC